MDGLPFLILVHVPNRRSNGYIDKPYSSESKKEAFHKPVHDQTIRESSVDVNLNGTEDWFSKKKERNPDIKNHMKMSRNALLKDKDKGEKKIAARNGTESNPNGIAGQGVISNGRAQQTPRSSNANVTGGQGDGKKGGGKQPLRASNPNGPGGQGSGKKGGGQQAPSSSNPNGPGGQGDGKKGGGQQAPSLSSPNGPGGQGEGKKGGGQQAPNSSNPNGPGRQGDGKKGGGQQAPSLSNPNGPGGQGDGKKGGGQQAPSLSSPNGPGGQGDGKKGGGQQAPNSSNPNGPGRQGDGKKGGGQQAPSLSNPNGPGGQGDGKKGGGQQAPSSSNPNGPGGQGDGKKGGGQQAPSSSNPNGPGGQGDGKKGGGQQAPSSSNPKDMAGPGDGKIESGLELPSSSVIIVSFVEELLDVLRNLLENNIQDYSAIDLPSLASSTKIERALEEKVKTIHDKAKEMAELCINRNSEAKYSSELLKELSDFSIESTESKRKELSKPPKKVLSTEEEIIYSKKNAFQQEENRHSRHFKHLDDNFSSAINVFNKQIESDYTAQLLKTLSEFSQTYDKTSIEKMLYYPPKLIHHAEEDYEKLKNPKYQGETEMNSPNTKISQASDAVRRIIREMEEKQSSESELQRATKKVENLTQELENLRDQTQQLQYEVNTLRTRLSELASAKLTNDNPAITDLSDPDRPTKLAEKYSSLYDNQWTDAFAELKKSNSKASEKDITGQLLNILIDGFNFCKEARQDQVTKLEQLMLNPAQSTKPGKSSYNNQVNEIFTKHLRDAAKVSSIVAGENIYKAFLSNTTMNTKYGKLMNWCDAYIEDCVKLCWLMQVQTPPVCIDLGTKEEQMFLKDTYREYTSSGKKIAFVVWPALLLHANGPLLMKGVAQGK